jgi:RNA polymerase sigma factor (sigma-70 family)
LHRSLEVLFGMPIDPEGLLLQNLDAINRIVAFACRRNRLEGADADDFAGTVRLRLVENDYKIVRSFQGRSSFVAYMSVVIQRMLLDQRIHEWGKWHASAEAQRLGETAVRVERLLYRDGRTENEILQILHHDEPMLTRERLSEMISRLPPREARRRVVDIGEAETVSDVRETAQENILENDRRRTAATISKLVRKFISVLPDDDRLLLQLRFESGMTIAEIARAMHLEQKPLYRRLEKHFRRLREELAQSGIQRQDIESLVGGDSGTVLDFQLRKSSRRPSTYAGGAAASPEEGSR